MGCAAMAPTGYVTSGTPAGEFGGAGIADTRNRRRRSLEQRGAPPRSGPSG